MTLLHDDCLPQWQPHSTNSSSSSSDTASAAALLPLLLQHSTVAQSSSTSGTATVTTATAAVEEHHDTGMLALLLRLLPELPLVVQYRATCDLPLLLRLPRISSALHSVLSQSCATDPAGSWQQCILQLLRTCCSSSAADSEAAGDGSSSNNTNSSSTAVVTATAATAKDSAIAECSIEAQCDKFKTMLQLYAELLARSACLNDAGCAEMDRAVALQRMQPQQSVLSVVQQLLAEVATKLRSLHKVS
jgi:hypothetical protein